MTTGLRGEIQAIRSDMGTEMQAIRSDMGAEMQAIRSDMGTEMQAVRVDIQAVRAEAHGNLDALRAEAHTNLTALRAEARADREALHAESRADRETIRAPYHSPDRAAGRPERARGEYPQPTGNDAGETTIMSGPNGPPKACHRESGFSAERMLRRCRGEIHTGRRGESTQAAKQDRQEVNARLDRQDDTLRRQNDTLRMI